MPLLEIVRTRHTSKQVSHSSNVLLEHVAPLCTALAVALAAQALQSCMHLPP
jgi:hypothetical protein